MPLSVQEDHKSRQISKTADDCTFKQTFTILGATDAKQAEQAVREQPFPSEDFEIAGNWRDAKMSVEVGYIFFDKANPSNNVFEGSRTYILKETDPEDDGIEWKLGMSVSNYTCTSALRAIAAPGSYPFWEQGTDGEGSPINVVKQNGQMVTQGIDIAVPTWKLTLGFECETRKWRALRPKLLRLRRGTMNGDVFMGFQPGECLFSSFDVTRIENGEKYQLSYTFDLSPNADYVAGDFRIENARGWDVKWSYWGSEVEVETADGTMATRPRCDGSFASMVYDMADFNELIPSGITI